MPLAFTVTVCVAGVPVQAPLVKKLYVTVPLAAVPPCPPMLAVSWAEAPTTSALVQARPVPLSITVVLTVVVVFTLKGSQALVEAP